MTVVDTSVVVDFLLGGGAARNVEELMAHEGEVAAPELLVFETLAVLRRETSRGHVPERRAQAAVVDLGELPVALFPALPLRLRAWELREDLTAADAIFLALAEQLEEPLATKDFGLAAVGEREAKVDVLRFG